MILGINCVRLLFKSESGAGISAPGIANLWASSNRRDRRVLQALSREPTIIKFMTMKMTVPRRIVNFVESVTGRCRFVGISKAQEDRTGRICVYCSIEGGVFCSC